ncbi:M14 family zinc carboxypeptidase [Patiriisocius marinus]|uniref:Peptidase M14 n=1 Tax=Patiriisocius marinus TaxID=1397112 RepID=A0A5J4IZX4_9FLAO|nr:M14 family zinc carboxypeptidase [Patiriisocius marinus]GER60536.1 peptidase M14 [Patiriisocius marinus]
MKNEHLKNWFNKNFESRISGRYITLNHLDLLLKDLQEIAKIEILGLSENGLEIPILKIGNGSKKVLAWSQMHGNESTTTKGVFDFLKFLNSKEIYKSEIDLFLKTHTFFVIPILNPDGAILNTRENFNKIDLNRDAQLQTQRESLLLRGCFDSIKPNLCLNLHDQRSIFGFANGNPATISFLAPAAEKSRKITLARKIAIGYINRAVQLLEIEIPNNIGRFDDSFNINCVGDSFTALETPTILVEAGHLGDDYSRDSSRYYVFLALVGILLSASENISLDKAMKNYFHLPENEKNFNDIVLINVLLEKGKLGTVGCQFKEVLNENVVEFQLIVDSISNNQKIYGHKIFDLQGNRVLINSQESYHIGQKIESIFDETHKNSIY